MSPANGSRRCSQALLHRRDDQMTRDVARELDRAQAPRPLPNRRFRRVEAVGRVTTP